MSWRIGRIAVEPVIELYNPISPRWLLPDVTDEELRAQLDWLAPHFVREHDLHMPFVVQSFVVTSGAQTIVVDTCIGNDKPRTMEGFDMLQTDFLERLSEHCAPSDVDLVLCTHMHLDHCGWSTRLEDGEWVPTFENAHYLYAEREWKFWNEETDTNDYLIEDSIQPIFDAGLAKLVADDATIAPGVRLISTPGHTPGHVSVLLESDGEAAVITGDLMHHPIQCAHPAYNCIADKIPELAAETRSAFLERCEREGLLVLGTHFAPPSAGRIRKRDEGYWFDTD